MDEIVSVPRKLEKMGEAVNDGIDAAP